MNVLCFSPIHMGEGWIEHSDQGRKQKSNTGRSSGSICICLSLLIHDISTGRVHFTNGDTEAYGHFVQDSVMPWALDSQNCCHYFCSVLIQSSVVSQKAPFSLSLSFSLSVSLLALSYSSFFPFLERKVKIEQFSSPGT